ncbi:hypothetical protein [Demequina sp.]|uniref:hypothetical protein n=1 Tax=Demequina sp. TaxID=2050685 RepID=UPI003D0CF2DC
MGNRYGGVAGMVALGAALVLALGVALTRAGELDYVTGTYTFVDPATEYSDASTVLVQNGVVTDVWISADEAAQEFFGYTPGTPADLLYEGNNTTIEAGENGEVTLCDHFSEGGENCDTFENIDQRSASAAARLSAWDGLADGTYRVDTRSVTWEVGSSHELDVKDRQIPAVPSVMPAIDTNEWGNGESNWVTYWVDGADEPFAACFDDPISYDEEWCVAWTPVA